MNRSTHLSTTFILFVQVIFPRNTFKFAQSTLKVSAFGQEVSYYAFAEGDQLVFNFEEVNGKEVRKLGIFEMPCPSKFIDYKTTKIENKAIYMTMIGRCAFQFGTVGRVREKLI